MTQKIIFFTAGQVVTSAEQAEIDKIGSALVDPAFRLVIRNGAGDNYVGGDIEAADYVFGTIPDAYSETAAFDPDDPPDIPLPSATSAIVKDGQDIAGTGGTFTITVEDGEITGGTWAAD